MALNTRFIVGLLILTPLLSLPVPADAQLRRIRDVARRTAESEADRIVAPAHP